MGGLEADTLLALAALLLLVVLASGLWLSRTRTLSHRLGSFSCSLARRPEGPWARGIAQYGVRRLYWWRLASIVPRARHVWSRPRIAVLSRTTVPSPDGHTRIVELRCRVAGETSSPIEVYLQMSPEAYAGLTSWIEATPTRSASVI
ncbi:DUF2550 family protein [Cellulomonas sp. NTE-D12]|uniref:DUF2550 family protein n=1 Tax=Cellulomonas sp. NTE-D12 TaxID=2962632 RepID=UPI0030816740|nr:hypothetical protein CELD12_10290 [Cellulomonas sp. NTE-D12]